MLAWIGKCIYEGYVVSTEAPAGQQGAGIRIDNIIGISKNYTSNLGFVGIEAVNLTVVPTDWASPLLKCGASITEESSFVDLESTSLIKGYGFRATTTEGRLMVDGNGVTMWFIRSLYFVAKNSNFILEFNPDKETCTGIVFLTHAFIQDNPSQEQENWSLMYAGSINTTAPLMVISDYCQVGMKVNTIRIGNTQVNIGRSFITAGGDPRAVVLQMTTEQQNTLRTPLLNLISEGSGYIEFEFDFGGIVEILVNVATYES